MFVLTAFNKETGAEERLMISGSEVFISRKSVTNNEPEVCKGGWADQCLADISPALKQEKQS